MPRNRNGNDNGRAAVATPAAPVIPFVAAAYEHVEDAFDVTETLQDSTSKQLGPFEVPAYGFLRYISLEVTATNGVLGDATLGADYPWNLFSEVTLLDVNGAPIFGPVSGYELFLANLFGGYAFMQDPRKLPDYGATINPSFILRIPVEISAHNGLGSIANQNSSASYKVRIRLAGFDEGNTPGTTDTLPDIRIRGRLHAWSQPAATDLAGRPQAVEPPMHGTTQYWSTFTRTLSAGAANVQLPRVGNMIRTLVVVVRDASGDRVANASMPDPIEFRWDTRQILYESNALRRASTFETLAGTLAADFPAGVYAYSFDRTAIGHEGGGSPNLWIPTVQSTRLEFVATDWPAGTVSVLTNDVAPAEINQAERYDQNSDTGFQPAPVG